MLGLLLSLAYAGPDIPELKQESPLEKAIQDVRTAEWKRESVEVVLAAGASDVEEGPELTRVRVEALGRLRDGAALPVLKRHRTHPDAEVRRAVAFALGLTPGAAPTIRDWLAELGSMGGGTELPLEGRLLAEYGVRWRLIEALGRAGDDSDVPRLVEALDAPWPWNEAGARALVRLQRRGIDIASALPALVRLQPDDVRTEIAAAQTVARASDALKRRGVLAPDDWAHIAERAARSPVSQARAAWARALLSAAGPEGNPDAGALVGDVVRSGLADTPLVAHAVLTWAPDDAIPVADVAAARDRHEESWAVWSAAIAREPSLYEDRPLTFDAATSLGAVFRRAFVIAQGASLAPRDQESFVEEAARLSKSDDVALLVEFATSREPPLMRTTAASRLHDLGVEREVLIPLLSAPDVAVREAAMGWMEGPPTAAIVDEIVLTARVEKDGEVLRAAIERLRAFREQRASSVRVSRFLESTLKRGATHRSKRVQVAARALAADLGVDVPGPPESAVVRELILPDGTVTTTTGDLPRLVEVDDIVAAHVVTDAGVLELELRPDVAPLAVHNFASLAAGGYFDGLLWHRVVPGFVVQGGCPRGDGWGGPGWTIADEVSDRPFVTGALGMARGDRDTGGSQFFVMTGSGRFLDGDYTWFGRLTSDPAMLKTLEPGDRIRAVRVFRSEPEGESGESE
jgi:peptidyl-prolyl cis-trans isomerase B (cyclophilin B)